MTKQYLFSKLIINRTIFSQGWCICGFDGMSYLTPRTTEVKEAIEDYTIEKEFIEKILNLGRYINDLESNIYVPPASITLESIKDECFDFYKDKKAKEYINTTLLNIFNEFSGIPLYTPHPSIIKFINSYAENLVPRKLPPLFNPYEHIVPAGLLAHTLYQMFSDFILPQKDLTFYSVISVDLTYNNGTLTPTTPKVNNIYEALMWYLINDKVKEKPLVRQCEYKHCKSVFIAENPKKVHCSKVCLNKAKVNRHYHNHKRKVDKNAEAER